MIDSLKRAVAIAQGLSAVCATCERYWEAKDLGASGCTVEGCCGPIGGGDFDGYRGPITDFVSLCFVCGGEPKHGIRVPGKLRVCAVCGKHFGLLRALNPRGVQVDAPRKIPACKPGLFEAIQEAETYFEEQEAAGKRV